MQNHQPWLRIRRKLTANIMSESEQPEEMATGMPQESSTSEAANQPQVTSEPDLSMGVTTAGDPIAPNSALRGGVLNNVLSGAIESVSAIADLSASVASGAVETAAGITTDSAARINDLAQQLLEELDKAQKKLV